MPYERVGKTAGTEYLDLAFRRLTFAQLDCVSWLLEREEDGTLNVFAASRGLFTMFTSREHSFEETLNWLQFAYTADQAGDYVAPASTVLTQYVIAEGDELFLTCLKHLWRLYP